MSLVTDRLFVNGDILAYLDYDIPSTATITPLKNFKITHFCSVYIYHLFF